MFPKTVLKKKDTMDGTIGSYDLSEKTIIINLANVKKYQPKRWRRYAFVTWCHEFVHFLQGSDSDDLIKLYADEIIAYKVEAFISRCLLLKPDWETPEEGAMSSLTGVIHEIKQYSQISKWSIFL